MNGSIYAGPMQQVLLTVLGIFATILIARIMLAWTRARLDNPISSTIHRFTQPVVGPLKRLLPNIGGFETASFMLLILLGLIGVVVQYGFGNQGLGDAMLLLLLALRRVLTWIYYFFFAAIIIQALMSWVVSDPMHPLYSFLGRITAPLTEPVRRLMSRFTGSMGIDFSPIIVLLGLQLAFGIAENLITQVARSLI